VDVDSGPASLGSQWAHRATGPRANGCTMAAFLGLWTAPSENAPAVTGRGVWEISGAPSKTRTCDLQVRNGVAADRKSEESRDPAGLRMTFKLSGWCYSDRSPTRVPPPRTYGRTRRGTTPRAFFDGTAGAAAAPEWWPRRASPKPRRRASSLPMLRAQRDSALARTSPGAFDQAGVRTRRIRRSRRSHRGRAPRPHGRL